MLSLPPSVSPSTPDDRTSPRSPSPPTLPASRPTRSASSFSPADPTPPRRVTPRPTSPPSTRSPPSLLPSPSFPFRVDSARSRRARSLPLLRPVPTEPSVSPEATRDTRVAGRSVRGMRPRPRLPRNKLQKGNWCLRVLLFASLREGQRRFEALMKHLVGFRGRDTLGPAQRIYCMITGFVL